jgi:hypothetical protein
MPLTFPLAHPKPAKPSDPSRQTSAPFTQTSAPSHPSSLSEDRLQAMCFEWFHNTNIEHRGRLFHNHQNPKNKIQGAILKAKGLIAGVSDFTFIDHPMRFIEMKIPGGVQSADQKKFQANVERYGHYYYLCYSFEEFKGLIEGFLSSDNVVLKQDT